MALNSLNGPKAGAGFSSSSTSMLCVSNNSLRNNDCLCSMLNLSCCWTRDDISGIESRMMLGIGVIGSSSAGSGGTIAGWILCLIFDFSKPLRSSDFERWMEGFWGNWRFTIGWDLIIIGANSDSIWWMIWLSMVWSKEIGARRIIAGGGGGRTLIDWKKRELNLFNW